jgi:hypothetical protein
VLPVEHEHVVAAGEANEVLVVVNEARSADVVCIDENLESGGDAPPR